jgi:4,5-dihydroxyphthalate decarboxylase
MTVDSTPDLGRIIEGRDFAALHEMLKHWSPATAGSLIAANDTFTAAQRSFPYATPWLEAELEDTAAAMGEDFHPYGLERTRSQIDMFAEEAFRLGLTSRRVTVEEYFADFLAS